MGTYLMLWEIDTDKLPISREERAAAWKPMIEMVKEGMQQGRIKEWGTFVGELNGFSVAEGTEQEIGLFNQQWVPFVKFKSFPVASIDDVAKMIDNMAK
jgi:hypothetical protein